MKICPKCDNKHSKSGVYCSRSCANSRNFTDTSKELKRTKSREWMQKAQLLGTYSYKNHKRKSMADRLDILMNRDWESLGVQSKRLRVIIEQHGKCNKCGLSEWMNNPITFEYEHKDGNNQNNNRDNVEALCPNCHSQTITWRGRKNGSEQDRIKRYLDSVEVPGFEPGSSPNLGSREV
jgi:hypothetical protein